MKKPTEFNTDSGKHFKLKVIKQSRASFKAVLLRDGRSHGVLKIKKKNPRVVWKEVVKHGHRTNM